ncbi:MAG: hypothetical protein R2818_14525 [Flavobacteriales bacterium]
MKSRYLPLLLALLCAQAYAQTPGPVNTLAATLANAPSALDNYYGPYCTATHAYALVNTRKDGKGREDMGLVYDLSGGTTAKVQAVSIPWQKNRNNLSAFGVFQGQPFVVYDQYDMGTNISQLTLQRYASKSFEADGEPVSMGDLVFHEKSVFVDQVKFEVAQSPDGSKLLLSTVLNIKHEATVLCWVFDERFELAWSGSYGLGTFGYEMFNEVKVADTGDVLFASLGIVLTDDLYSLDKAGEKKVNVLAANTRHRDVLFHRFRGGTEQHWNGKLPDGRQLIDGSMTMNANGVFAAGVLEAEKGASERNWVVVELDEALHPVAVVAEGPGAKETRDRNYDTRLQVASDGSMLFLYAHERLGSVALHPDGVMKWTSSSTLGRTPDVYSTGTEFFAGKALSVKDMDDIAADRSLGENYDQRPVLIRWDGAGKVNFTPVIPFAHPVKKGAYYVKRPQFHNVQACGQYVDWDNERRPTLYQVAMDL